jgi:[CysO sulfur-carrier protein]-S-L-cysteine hydrolase
MEQLILTRLQVTQMIAHARSEAPLEACGLLGGKNGRAERVFPAANALQSPTRYQVQLSDLVDALKVMEEQGWGPDPLGIYHSHPDGPETPSATDVAEAFYPDSVYIIIAYPMRCQPSLRGFRIVDGHFDHVSLVIAEDQTVTPETSGA